MYIFKFNIVIFLISYISHVKYTSSLKANVWKSNKEYPNSEDYPEIPLLKKANKLNTAIGFTGGGSRAFTAAMGYLAGLRDLDLLKNIGYMGGISGGSWATITFTYVQNVSDDNIFLGPIIAPQDIKYKELQEVDPLCVRSLPYKDLTLICLEAFETGIVDSIAAGWAYGVSKTYLEPMGIMPNTRFSWDLDTVEDIKDRNPELMNEPFLIPKNSNRPFPIIATTIVGPSEGAPFTPSNQNFTLMEITPLYIGQFKNLDVSYTYGGILNSILDRKPHVKHQGGAVEPFAFARKGNAPKHSISSKMTSGIIDVPEPEVFIDLQYAAGASSYAPGAFFESILIPGVAEKLSMEFDYWSPSSTVPESTTMMYTDGGCYENIPLISFIQRRVPKIVLFFLSVTPLQPFEDWNVTTDAYTGHQITDDFAAFFGVKSTVKLPRWEDRSYEIENNQVFDSNDFTRVVIGLQTAQQVGKGIIATFNLTTVENTWWGIPSGLTFEITFSYLGRLPQWEALLSTEMYDLVVPHENSSDLSVDISKGPFKDFPHYPTTGGNINTERANLLADMTGWSILQNSEIFKNMLS